jgi:hypothetical protein
MPAPSTAFVKQYQDSIALLVQQTESRARSAVLVDTNFKGEQKFYDQYNSDDMVEISSRYEDTPVQTPNHDRRMVSPRYFVSSTLEDPVDALQMLIDPKSTYMMAKVNAANRQTDDLIIAALGGTAYSGKTGSTSNTLAGYDSGSHVIASGSAGLTKTKCINAKRLLDKDEVEKNDRFLLHSADGLADMLGTTEVASSDYNVVKALVQGEINTWLGFTWLHSERLSTNDSSERLLYAFQKYGLQLAIQKDITGRIDERTDKNYAWQVYLKMCMGAVRLEEARVVQIAVTETQWA